MVINIGVELPRRPTLLALRFKRNREVAKVKRKWCQLFGNKKTPGFKRVILGQRIRKSLALADENIAAIAVEASRCHTNQDHDQRGVKDEIAGFVQIPLLGGNKIGFAPNPKSAPAQILGSLFQYLCWGCSDQHALVCRQLFQSTGGYRRQRTQGLPVGP